MFEQIHLREDAVFPEGARLIGCSALNLLVGPNSSGKSTLLRKLLTLNTSPTQWVSFIWKSAEFRRELIERVVRIRIKHNSGDLSFDSQFIPDSLALRFREDGVGVGEELWDAVVHGFRGLDLNQLWIQGAMGSDGEQRLRGLIDRGVMEDFNAVRPKVHYFQPERSLRTDPGPGISGIAPARTALAARVRQIRESADSRLLEDLREWLVIHIPMFRSYRLAVANVEYQDALVLEPISGRGEKIPVDRIGSGTQQLILFAAPLVLDGIASSNGPMSLLLLEEPESNLHPPLWRSMLSVVRSLVKDARVQAFVTTHSPSVVKSLRGATFFATMQRDTGLVGGCELRNMTETSNVAGLRHSVMGRHGHEDALAHLLLGGRVLIVEGPSDQVAFSVLADKAGLDDVLVVTVQGDADVITAVRSLRAVFNARVAGIVDRDRGRDDHSLRTAGVHVIQRRNLEEYFVQTDALRAPSAGKVGVAYNAVHGLEGYELASDPSLDEELTEAIQLMTSS